MPCSSASILLGTLATCATRIGKHPLCATDAPACLSHSCSSMLALALDVHQAMEARGGALQLPRCRTYSCRLVEADLT